MGGWKDPHQIKSRQHAIDVQGRPRWKISSADLSSARRHIPISDPNTHTVPRHKWETAYVVYYAREHMSNEVGNRVSRFPSASPQSSDLQADVSLFQQSPDRPERVVVYSVSFRTFPNFIRGRVIGFRIQRAHGFGIQTTQWRYERIGCGACGVQRYR